MLKRLLNECILDAELVVTGRLLVKEPAEETESRKGKRDHLITMGVRTYRPDGSLSIYLPGASLKGALRSQAERIARTLNPEGACDPFAVISPGRSWPADLACSERIVWRQEKKDPTLDAKHLYTEVCPICRLFGHVAWGRRLRITDFYPVDTPDAVQMTHIGIDRVSGGVATKYEGQGKPAKGGRTFNQEYVYKARLRGSIILENYELWQLGLLGFLWRDMAEGLLTVGHKQTAGAGVVQPGLNEMRLTQLGVVAPAQETLQGVGALFAEAQAYGYQAKRETATAPGMTWRRESDGVRWEARLGQTEAESLWKQLRRQTARVLETYRWPDGMKNLSSASLSSEEGRG